MKKEFCPSGLQSQSVKCVLFQKASKVIEANVVQTLTGRIFDASFCCWRLADARLFGTSHPNKSRQARKLSISDLGWASGPVP